MHIGIWSVSLLDDGTMDTVVEVAMRVQPHIREEIRYSDTSHLRNRSGALTRTGFEELARDAVESVETARA